MEGICIQYRLAVARLREAFADAQPAVRGRAPAPFSEGQIAAVWGDELWVVRPSQLRVPEANLTVYTMSEGLLREVPMHLQMTLAAAAYPQARFCTESSCRRLARHPRQACVKPLGLRCARSSPARATTPATC